MWLQKKIITLSQLKIMTFPLALLVLREHKRIISVRNFALKFQVVAQKTAKNVSGYFFCRTLYIYLYFGYPK